MFDFSAKPDLRGWELFDLKPRQATFAGRKDPDQLCRRMTGTGTRSIGVSETGDPNIVP